MKTYSAWIFAQKSLLAKEYELAEWLKTSKSITHYSLGTNNGSAMMKVECS